MLSNLKAEMARSNVSVGDIAVAVGKSYRTISDRLKGKVAFPIDEAIAVKKEFFPGMKLEDLFAQDKTGLNTGHKEGGEDDDKK